MDILEIEAMKRAGIDRNVLVIRAKCFEIDNLWFV